jgi:hypothetical protein
MKKFFLFAAAVAAAMTVNAKVISFADIVYNSSADSAVLGFNAAFVYDNINIKGAANSAGDSYLVEVYQTAATTEWDVTVLELKADNQVYFTFKDANDNKLVMKAYKEYVQPNGKAACMVITGLNNGDKVKITLKKALNKETLIEGATVESDMLNATEVELTAAAEEIRVYSKSVDGKSDAKWQVISVEVPDGAQGIENVNNAVKAEKFFENGQLVIIKNGVRYNALGAQL